MHSFIYFLLSLFKESYFAGVEESQKEAWSLSITIPPGRLLLVKSFCDVSVFYY